MKNYRKREWLVWGSFIQFELNKHQNLGFKLCCLYLDQTLSSPLHFYRALGSVKTAPDTSYTGTLSVRRNFPEIATKLLRFWSSSCSTMVMLALSASSRTANAPLPSMWWDSCLPQPMVKSVVKRCFQASVIRYAFLPGSIRHSLCGKAACGCQYQHPHALRNHCEVRPASCVTHRPSGYFIDIVRNRNKEFLWSLQKLQNDK